jgi:hypothetical protein
MQFLRNNPDQGTFECGDLSSLLASGLDATGRPEKGVA